MVAMGEKRGADDSWFGIKTHPFTGASPNSAAMSPESAGAIRGPLRLPDGDTYVGRRVEARGISIAWPEAKEVL